MKERLYPLLLVPSEAEATEAIRWLDRQKSLPRLLITTRASLEYSVGRGLLLAAFDAEREADDEASGDA